MSGSDITHKKYASVAQSVEQGTENPRVGGSIPPRGTKAKDRDRAGVAQLAEQLICNQQVAGSIPVTSSNKGRFPSGQREQTVNLPTMSSVVRIHPFPPLKKAPENGCLFQWWEGVDHRTTALKGRGSAIREAVAFAKLLSTYSRRRKAGSEPPPHIRTSKRRPFSVVGRGGFTNQYGRQNDVLFLWWEGVDLRTTAL